MTRWVFALWLAFAGVAHAQPLMMGVLGGGGAPYVGPGDIVSGATAWYGLRGYSAAYAASGTGKAVNIRRASDNATMDIVILANGNLDVATATTFCSSTSCYVTNWYDQTGNGNNATQATAGTQPLLNLTCLDGGGIACLSGNGAYFLLKSTIPTYSQPYFYSIVSERVAAFNNYNVVFDTGGGGSQMVYYPSPNNAYINAGSVQLVTVNDSNLHSLQLLFNSSSSVFNVDGVANTVNAGTANSGTNLAIMGLVGGGFYLNGYLGEVGFWASSVNGTNRNALCHNDRLYYGTAGTC